MQIGLHADEIKQIIESLEATGHGKMAKAIYAKTKRSALEKRYIQAADDMSKDGELEVDEDAVVSMGDDPGAYVQAWLWVAKDRLKKAKR